MFDEDKHFCFLCR